MSYVLRGIKHAIQNKLQQQLIPCFPVRFSNNIFLLYILVGKNGIRLSNFNIKIGESAEGQGDANTLCVSNAGVAAGDTKTFNCISTLTGRYLYIKTNLQEILTLCEVKVFGEFL